MLLKCCKCILVGRYMQYWCLVDVTSFGRLLVLCLSSTDIPSVSASENLQLACLYHQISYSAATVSHVYSEALGGVERCKVSSLPLPKSLRALYLFYDFLNKDDPFFGENKLSNTKALKLFFFLLSLFFFASSLSVC